MTKSKQKIIDGLDSFTESYIDTALWSSADADSSTLDKFSAHEIGVDCLNVMVRDCKSFQANSHLWIEDNCDDTEAGRDFWLTRNGHGAGFWDGDYPKNGDELTILSSACGMVNLYVHSGKIYSN